MTVFDKDPRPQEINGLHESAFRCFGILERVKAMLRRGDSAFTISEMIVSQESAEQIDITPHLHEPSTS